jgi:hypothetical protein
MKLFHVEWSGKVPTREEIQNYTKDEKLEVLLKICKAGWHQDFIKFTDQFKLDMNSLGKSGWNCFHFSTYYGHINIILYLINLV